MWNIYILNNLIYLKYHCIYIKSETRILQLDEEDKSTLYSQDQLNLNHILNASKWR